MRWLIAVAPLMLLTGCETPAEKSRRLADEARAALSSGERASALEQLEQSLSLNADNEDAYLLRATIDARTDPAHALERLTRCTTKACRARKVKLRDAFLADLKRSKKLDVPGLHKVMLSLSVGDEGPDPGCALLRLLLTVKEHAWLRSKLGKADRVAVERLIAAVKPTETEGWDDLITGHHTVRTKAMANTAVSSCAAADKVLLDIEGRLQRMAATLGGKVGRLPGSSEGRRQVFYHTLFDRMWAQLSIAVGRPLPHVAVLTPEASGLRVSRSLLKELWRLSKILLATGGRHRVASPGRASRSLRVRISRQERVCSVAASLGEGAAVSARGGCKPDGLRRSVAFAVRKVAGVWAGPEPGLDRGHGEARVKINARDGSVLLRVPAGPFLRGSNSGKVESRPRVSIHLAGFYIDQHEVSVAQYRLCMRLGRCERPAWIDEDGELRTNEEEYTDYKRLIAPFQPIIGVSWEHATAYCRWAGKRLPSEAEWEKAARGTDGRRYPWGNDKPSCQKANMLIDDRPCRDRSVAVTRFSRSASPYGALQMAGNVLEWVQDWYDADYFKKSPRKNPRGPAEGDYRVARGASWSNTWDVSTIARWRFLGEHKDLGFRCARSR